MNIVSDPAHAHPTWCDVARSCTHPDSLAARGETEDQVPIHLSRIHMSAPVTVGDPRHSDPSLTLWCDRQVDAPVTDEVESVGLTLRIPERGFTVTVSIDPADLAALTLAVDQVRLVVGTAATTPRLVDRAVAALRDFGAQYIDDAVTLLAHWRHADDMSDEEFGEAIGAFPARPPLPPREIPWPAELDPQRRQDGDR